MPNKEQQKHLLYGPPASGKSTVASEICNSSGMEYLSVGEMTRREIASGSLMGQQLKKCLDQVVEYPVELITRVIERRIVDTLEGGRGFILDGFPKYPRETSAFLGLMEKHNFAIDAVILIDIPFEEALKRVSNRLICQNCLSQTSFRANTDGGCGNCGGILIVRDDDKPEILLRRYKDYKSSIGETLSILSGHYSKLVRVDGSKPLTSVLREILSNLNSPGSSAERVTNL